MSKHVRCQSKHSPFLNDWCGECNQLWPCDVARLEQWNAEAAEVIERWELVYEALGDVGGLGQNRADAVLSEVLRLKAEVERLNDVVARMDAEHDSLVALYVDARRRSGDEEPTDGAPA